ncbi:hypothetical protein B0H16DRAFT_1484481 [Mycena metata]|uniref:Uncharacterized protein n=1 Tax=Mycena metata TaxID=1033252 RepID=A0AAD7DSL3_9AGAR|nr:hypothetical protein B0H16DRAFT_1484481 [Mycena metata]
MSSLPTGVLDIWGMCKDHGASGTRILQHAGALPHTTALHAVNVKLSANGFSVQIFDRVLISGRTPGILLSISDGTAVVMVPPGQPGQHNSDFMLVRGISVDEIQPYLLVGDQLKVGSSVGFLVELDDQNEQAIVIEEQTGIILRERRDLVRHLPPLEPPPGVEPALWAWHLLETQAAARANLHGVVIQTFRGFDGREVEILGFSDKSPKSAKIERKLLAGFPENGCDLKWKGREFKGQAGTLIGTAMTVQAQAGRWTDMFRGAIAQVKLTRYHLTWDMYIPPRFKAPARPPTPIQDVDRDGTWICEAVRGVRLDVRVDCEDPLLKKPVSNRLKRFHGQIGRTHMIKVMFDAAVNPMGWPENFRPVRTRGTSSIAEFTVRVVIIGPHMNGSEVYVGRYARVRPEDSDGDRVSVVFALDQERVPGQGFLPPGQGIFPVKSLCSACIICPTNNESQLGWSQEREIQRLSNGRRAPIVYVIKNIFR